MTVTCADYRLERRLLALKKKLHQEDLSQAEREDIQQEVSELERTLGMD